MPKDIDKGTEGRPGTKSKRRLMFEALGNSPLTSKQLSDAIGNRRVNGGVAILLRSELAAGRIRKEPVPGKGNRDINLYELTAKGERHLLENCVDSWAKDNHLLQVGRLERLFRLVEDY